MKPNKQMRKSINEWKNNPAAPKGVVPKCIACDGSGYYDTQRHGKTPKCGSCNGTGLESGLQVTAKSSAPYVNERGQLAFSLDLSADLGL